MIDTKPQTVHLTDSAVIGVGHITELCKKGYRLVTCHCINMFGMLEATLELEESEAGKHLDASRTDVQAKAA